MRGKRERLERTLRLLQRLGLASVTPVYTSEMAAVYSVVVTGEPGAKVRGRKMRPATTSRRPMVSPFLTSPPSEAEVQEYLQSIGAQFSAQEFLTAMERRGWTWGKQRLPVVSWKAEARTWRLHEKRRQKEDDIYAGLIGG